MRPSAAPTRPKPDSCLDARRSAQRSFCRHLRGTERRCELHVRPRAGPPAVVRCVPVRTLCNEPLTALTRCANLPDVSVGDEHFLTSLYVHDAFSVRGLEIPISDSDGRRRHLVLTGPNSSGKSSILRGLYQSLSGADSSKARSEQRPFVEARGVPLEGHDERFVAYMRAGRMLELHHPAGPVRFDEQQFLRSEGAAAMLLQFLVNLRTRQAYAREDGEQSTVDRITQRFDALERHIRQILDDDRAHLQLDRMSFEFRIVLGDGRTVAFDDLADGIASVIFMWATLMIPVHSLQRSGIAEPAGWALIDEPELHLHVRLQRMVLPLLTAMCPNVQFIVATHSPAVLASISDASVLDLASRTHTSSNQFKGIRYGTIYKRHFGLSTDVDLETTEKLRRLKELRDRALIAGSNEHEEYRRLLIDLGEVPSLLVEQEQKRLEFDAA